MSHIRFTRRFGLLLTAALFLAGATSAHAQESFRDDFNTTSWGENTGTRPFSTPWSGPAIADGDATRAAGEVRLREPGSRIDRSADLSGFATAVLNLRLGTRGTLEASDCLNIQVASASAGPFTTLARRCDDIVGWLDLSFPISAQISATTTLRFLVESTSATGEAFALDFVEISATEPLTCFSDTFDVTPLNPADWATQSVSGPFGAPRIVNNRLRLTDASNNVATAASLLRLFPGANNRVVAEFDFLAYGGNGADGIAITFSDANINPVAGGFGGSLGYAQRTDISGFAGGWLGVGLDAFGNFSNPTESRVGGPAFRPDAIALRGSGTGTSGYPYLGGTATLSPGVDISGATPGPNHRYRITLDHSNAAAGAIISVERRTTPTGSFVTLVAPFNVFAVNPAQSAVPANFRLSITGSTGGQTNIHELDNFSVCATRMNPIIQVDHFRFFHDGQGLTCGPESIRVVACQNADCTQEIAGPVRVTLSPSGWVGGDTQTITSGQTLSLRHVTPGNVTLTVSASDPPRRPFTADRCFVGAVQQANCTLNFADSGFVFDVPNHDADVPQAATIAAVRRDITTQACVPGFANVTRSLHFWSAYQNPSSGTLPVSVNASNVATAAPGTALPLAFNSAGVANISVRYPDAGSIRLFARYTGSTATGDAGLVMNSQDDFVARPRHFLLTIPSNPAAVDANGGVFTRAARPFSVTVAARNASGVNTPNFGREIVPEGVRLESTLHAPVGGLNPTPVAVPGFGPFSGGTSSGLWRWDEVGIIRLLPRLADGDYLGAGDVTETLAAVPVGRFVPERLEVTPNTPTLLPACAAGAFGYVGQEFGFATAPRLTVTGRNAQGAVTGNYGNDALPGSAGDFWKLAGSLSGRSYTDTATPAATPARILTRSTNGGNALLEGVTAPPFDGSGTLTVVGDRLTYAKPVAPAVPFDARMDLSLPISDLTDSDGVCFDVAPLGSCDPLTMAGITGTTQRWGRIAIAPAFGPELLDLQVPMRAEFFAGPAFVPNSNDVCSLVSSFTLADPNPADALDPAHTCIQDSGSPGSSGLGCSAPGLLERRYTASPPVAAGGEFTLWLRAPGAGRVGILDLTPSVPAWMRFNWTGTGPSAPTARVGFGVYQGDHRAIHRRELY